MASSNVLAGWMVAILGLAGVVARSVANTRVSITVHGSQQASLEAHELAFAYFGGVFTTVRYDNLKSAVKKILRGYQREETTRFIAFRSHWGFALVGVTVRS